MSKQGSVLGNILSTTVIIFILIAVGGAIAYFTEGFTSDIKSFFVIADGKPLMNTTKGYVLSAEKPNKFDIKYTFGNNQQGYSVKILPNVTQETDFDFTVDGAVYRFGAEPDLTQGFAIDIQSDNFTIDGAYTLQSVLDKVYPNSTVIFNSEDVSWNEDLFLLLIYSSDESACITVSFKNYIAVTSVAIPQNLLFEEQQDGTVKALN